ncbi:hypothetical protein D1610_08015 [Sphingomonas gilva]|uniref:Uncharacterized protein n=1 Tax=Sphingomonas gilva TaxID=2305907 RepID=A0A396RSN4_9SPHN|nr:hypothetical protein [Sphingomonas gilva]RHW18392.1 hypothetical protein D1610_08015 [Sphingomonas gilva]
MLGLRIAITLAALSATPAIAQVARPDTVEEFVRLYGGAAAARSYAAAEKLAAFENNIALAEGCGANCAVRALIVDARPRSDSASRQLCFENPIPLAARIGDDPAYGFVTHAEATVTTREGAAVLAYRLFARMDTRTASRAKPNLTGDWCAQLPVALREAAAAGDWSIALRAIPPRDARYAYADLASARLAPRTAAGVMPVQFDPAGMGFAEILVRSAKPGARISVSGTRSKLRTPATISLTEAAAGRVELQQGKLRAQLDKCASQWAADRNAFVFDCPI